SGITDFKNKTNIMAEHKYFNGSGAAKINLFALSIDLSIVLKLMTGSNPGINILFVKAPTNNAAVATIAPYIIAALFPITLYILISSGKFVAAPAIKKVIATPGAAPLATNAAINGICPTAHTYITVANIAIFPRDSILGFPRYLCIKVSGKAVTIKPPKIIPIITYLLTINAKSLNAQIIPDLTFSHSVISSSMVIETICSSTPGIFNSSLPNLL